MKIPLKETFSMQALPPERQLWQANPTDQKTLLALHSGNVSGVNVPGGSPQEIAAKEKEERETADILIQQAMEAAYERFLQTFEEMKIRIAETRLYFQKKLDDLEQDEAAFKKDVILLQQGLEVYPDANDPRRYFYQDECGDWHELQDEAFLEEAKDIHRQKGAVHTMQNKKAWDEYEDGVKKGLATTDHAEARIDEIKRKVNEDVISPDEGRKKVEEIGGEITQSKSKLDNLFNSAFEDGADFIGNETKNSEQSLRESNLNKTNPSTVDSDLLGDFADPEVSVSPFLSPSK